MQPAEILVTSTVTLDRRASSPRDQDPTRTIWVPRALALLVPKWF